MTNAGARGGGGRLSRGVLCAPLVARGVVPPAERVPNRKRHGTKGNRTRVVITQQHFIHTV